MLCGGHPGDPFEAAQAIRHSRRWGTSNFDRTVTMLASEMRWHCPQRINATVAGTPGTRARSAPTTSTSPWAPEHPQGQILRSLSIGTPSGPTVGASPGRVKSAPPYEAISERDIRDPHGSATMSRQLAVDAAPASMNQLRSCDRADDPRRPAPIALEAPNDDKCSVYLTVRAVAV